MSKILTLSEDYNPNYVSRVVRVDNVRPHPNADRLDIVSINGNSVIVGRGEVNNGDVLGFASVESALSKEYLHANSEFSDPELNSNPEHKGYFNSTGRVRAVKLRGVISTGYLFPLHTLRTWISAVGKQDWNKYVGTEFDTVLGKRFSKKYFEDKPKPAQSNKLEGFDRIVPQQFNFHYDTKMLNYNLDLIHPDDIISITTKLHGTSLIASNVLVNKPLGWKEKVAKKFSINVVDKEYNFIYSSSRIIKNRYINENVGKGYYDVDLWTIAGDILKPYIPKGYSIYAEVTGYVPGTDKYIQSLHDYGSLVGEFKIWVYRVTITNNDGVVFELPARQVQQWAREHGLTPVPELYYGTLADLYPYVERDSHWSQNILEFLQREERFYMELDSPDCKNKVPHEGIVLRNDTTNENALKLKTKRHYLMEGDALDRGENIDLT